MLRSSWQADSTKNLQVPGTKPGYSLVRDDLYNNKIKNNIHMIILELSNENAYLCLTFRQTKTIVINHYKGNDLKHVTYIPPSESLF